MCPSAAAAPALSLTHTRTCAHAHTRARASTPHPPRSFLQLTSVLAGLGLSIREANAEADGEWSFIVSDHAGKALTYGAQPRGAA